MIDTARRLHASFVAAYEPYVRDRVTLRAPAVPEHDLAGMIAEGRAWLDDRLTTLLSLPFRDQPRGPLELFQESLRFPTELLAASGLAEPTRPAAAIAALPGDRFDLAPASSRDLGDEAWTAHLAWGVAKAAALRD